MMGKSGLPAGPVLGVETWSLWVRVLISDNSKGAKSDYFRHEHRCSLELLFTHQARSPTRLLLPILRSKVGRVIFQHAPIGGWLLQEPIL